MKNLFLCLLLTICVQISFADGTCKSPIDSAVIYFGNGINTTNASAQASLNRLMQEMGGEYNGQKLEYAVAYNQTGGIGVDLLQSEIQLGAQFNILAAMSKR